MDDLSRIAGLPEELGIDEALAKEGQYLRVRMESRRYGKPMTIVEGFLQDYEDIDGLAKRLKQKLATGGTVTDGHIELQGDHTDRVPKLLQKEGFEVED